MIVENCAIIYLGHHSFCHTLLTHRSRPSFPAHNIVHRSRLSFRSFPGTNVQAAGEEASVAVRQRGSPIQAPSSGSPEAVGGRVGTVRGIVRGTGRRRHGPRRSMRSTGASSHAAGGR